MKNKILFSFIVFFILSFLMYIQTTFAGIIPPGQITGVTAVSATQVKLSWITPGDDGYSGNVTDGAWQIKYSSAAGVSPDTAVSRLLYLQHNLS